MTSTTRTDRYPSPLARQLQHWRIKQVYQRGEVRTYVELGARFGYTESMARKIVRYAQPPDLHGLDEQTALRASAAGVPLRAAARLIATHAEGTIAEQAAALSVSIGVVKNYRLDLLRAGLLDKDAGRRAQEYQRKRQQHERVVRLVREGFPRTDVAEMTEVGHWTIQHVVVARGHTAAIREGEPCYTLTQAKDLLGIDDKTLIGCIRDGYLFDPRPKAFGNRGTPKKRQQNKHYCFKRADLYDFLRQRGAWPRYSIATIRDAELRRFAEQQQAAAGGCWRSAAECGRLVGIGASASAQRVRQGWLRGRETTTHGRIVYYWFTTGEPIPPFRGRL